MRAVLLFDELLITPSDRVEVVCTDPSVPEDNTVLRAVRLLQEVADYPPVRIELVKRIPNEAGFGGGSSDAAGVLRSARQLMRSVLPAHEVRSIVRALGTDTAFFLHGGSARGEGYGDQITPLPDEAPQWLLLALPDCRCRTPEMYARLDQEPRDWREFPSDPWELWNDFELVAPPECQMLLEELSRRGFLAGLTGSGSAVFAICKGESEAKRLAASLDVPWSAVARTLTRAESL
ncbi:MAG: hypothetical protein C4320_05750 [Armatimonadota bacterium]